MALSRILSQTIPRAAALHPQTTASLITHHNRHRSNKSHNHAQLIEVDLDTSSSSSSEEIINAGIKKLEDAIHTIVVRRAAPDWLPFLPGYSYWVPPRPKSNIRRNGSMFDVIGQLSNNSNYTKNRRISEVGELMTEDEQMCLSSQNKGWPSSSFFIDGTSPVHPPIPVMEVEVEVEVKIQDNENADNNKSISED